MGHLTVEERSSVNFDHPEALDWELCLETITELASGRTVKRPVYDFTSHTRTPDRMPLGSGPTNLSIGFQGDTNGGSFDTSFGAFVDVTAFFPLIGGVTITNPWSR